jgi:hypothetical protein
MFLSRLDSSVRDWEERSICVDLFLGHQLRIWYIPLRLLMLEPLLIATKTRDRWPKRGLCASRMR